jgi:hypothetical protein
MRVFALQQSTLWLASCSVADDLECRLERFTHGTRANARRRLERRCKSRHAPEPHHLGLGERIVGGNVLQRSGSVPRAVGVLQSITKKCAQGCTTVDATKAVHRGKHGCKQSFAQHSHQAVRCPQVVRGGHAAHGASRRVHNARNTWSNSHRQHVLQHLSLIAVVDEGCNERLDSSIARNRQLVL